MQAVVIRKPGEVRLEEVPVPEPAPGFARIRVIAAAICATDLEVLDGRIAANYPLIPGHEWSGYVDAVGDAADSDWVGRAVVGSNDVVCLKCEACRRGDWRYCRDFEEIGFKRNGAYADYFLVPVYGLCEKPDNVPFEQAALCEPLGVALGTMQKAQAKAGDTCLILGSGSIGLCMLSAARAIGMRKIVVCAKTPRRLEIARKMGAWKTLATDETDLMEEMRGLHPDGTDVVVDCTGMESCIQAALKLARKGGTVALAGYGRGKIMQIRMDDIHINNLRVVGAGNNWNMHKRAIQMLSEGCVDFSDMVSLRLSLSEYERGLRTARERPEGFVKAVFLHEPQEQ